MNRLDRLRKDGYLTDKEARDFVSPVLDGMGKRMLIQQGEELRSEQGTAGGQDMDLFYTGEED